MAIRWPFTAHSIRSAPHAHQVDEGHGTDESADEIVEYAKDGDIFDGSTDKGKRDCIENAAELFSWVEENCGFKQTVCTALCGFSKRHTVLCELKQTVCTVLGGCRNCPGAK